MARVIDRVLIPLVIVAAVGLLSLSFEKAEEQAVAPEKVEGSCLECHGDLAQGKLVHSPVQDESCDMCHEAEGDRHQFTLPEPIAEACTNCHDDPAEAEGHVHGPVSAGRCTSCHDPHHSEFESLLRAERPDLCWLCHGRSIRRDDQPAVRNIRKELSEATVVHDAVEMGCDGCHPAHASERAGLFTESFPAGPYARGFEESYELCFECHDSDPILDPNSTETGFRDGTRNLHAVHVARPKSRSCALCHSPHGGGPHLLRESAPFGHWELPIGYEAQEGGGKCATACHVTRVYSIRPEDEGGRKPGKDESGRK